MERLTEYHCGVAVIRKEVRKEASKLLAEYEDIGLAPEEVVQLKEKATPKKPIFNHYTELYYCPVCERRVYRIYHVNCNGCGQAIDWSKDNEQ